MWDHVEYWLERGGKPLHTQNYGVIVYKGGKVVEKYRAGNNPRESSPDQSIGECGLDDETMLKYARQTAKEMAEQHGISKRHIRRVKENPNG